jgi:YHS domain-containing protein
MGRAFPGHQAQRVLAVMLGLLFAGFSFAPTRGAVTTELVVADRIAGVALYGFDPVAYFLDGKALAGTKAYELDFGGLSWRFRNEANRAAFAASPEVYVPRFGGYDPVALARGVPLPGHPALFVVHDGHLFLFSSPENRKAFLARPEIMAAAAKSAWPKVRRTLLP